VGLVDELLRLEQLHQRGTLSREEFERAKLKLLESEQPDATDRVTRSLEEANYQAELARIDREWEMERRQYMMTGRYGRSYVPTEGSSLLGLIVGGGFAVVWTIGACIMFGAFSSGPVGGSPFGFFAAIFPIFGVLFIILMVTQGLRGITKSQQYRDAEKRYQSRRAAAKRSEEK